MIGTTEVVWKQNRFTCGQYTCRVERTGDLGRLTVTLIAGSVECPVEHLVHEEPVRVDRDDSERWRARCEAVISYPDLRTIDTR